MARPRSTPSDPHHKFQTAEVKEFINDLNKPSLPDSRQANKITAVPTRKIPVINEANDEAPPPPVKPPLEEVLKEPGKSKLTDMSKLQRDTRRHFPWGWVLGSLAVLAAVSVAGFFVFNQARHYSGDRVQFQMEMPTTTASGSDFVITFKYQNMESVDLVQAEINVEYPDNFTFIDSSQPPKSKYNNAFELGTVKSGRAGTLTVTGTILGSVGAEPEFTATLNYRPANFSSEFRVEDTATTKITTSILELELDGPTELSPGASGDWIITYRNTADRDLSRVQIEALYPAGLNVTATDPAATQGGSVWQLDNVANGYEGQIKITGTASGEVGDSLELIVRAGILSASGTSDLQAEQKLLIVVITSGTAVAIAVNGQTENSVVEPGDTLNYSIRLTNDGESELRDVQLALTLAGAAVDMATLDNPSEAPVTDHTITWTKEQVLGLADMKPNQDVTMRFSVGTVKTLTVDSDDDINAQVTAKIVVTSPDLPELDGDQQATETTTKLATVFDFTAAARYYNDAGAALGSGPIPPVVGETTSYRIFWTVTNTTSDANNLTVTATLPAHVFWTGKNISRDAGDINFDAETRVVTWTLNKVPAGTGSRLPALGASFEVSITPTASLVGTDVVLCPSAQATATDSFTARAIDITEPTLTTDLPTDPQAAGEGTVQAS